MAVCPGVVCGLADDAGAGAGTGAGTDAAAAEVEEPATPSGFFCVESRARPARRFYEGIHVSFSSASAFKASRDVPRAPSSAAHHPMRLALLCRRIGRHSVHPEISSFEVRNPQLASHQSYVNDGIPIG